MIVWRSTYQNPISLGEKFNLVSHKNYSLLWKCCHYTIQQEHCHWLELFFHQGVHPWMQVKEHLLHRTEPQRCAHRPRWKDHLGGTHLHHCTRLWPAESSASDHRSCWFLSGRSLSGLHGRSSRRASRRGCCREQCHSIHEFWETYATVPYNSTWKLIVVLSCSYFRKHRFVIVIFFLYMNMTRQSCVFSFHGKMKRKEINIESKIILSLFSGESRKFLVIMPYCFCMKSK